MPQISGPLADQTFTDAQWRAIIGDEPAIVGDVNGTSYNLTLSASSDVATLGSTTQDSTAVVAGFMHRIEAGQTQEITIPVATSGARTDIIGVRYDPTYTTVPGPCRLYRVAGVEGAGVPVYDAGPPGAEDLPLWAVTRAPGQALSQATRVDMRIRRGPNLQVPRTADLFALSAPIGTHAYVVNDDAEYVRRLDPQLNPIWTTVGRHNAGTSPAYTGTTAPLGQTLLEKIYVGNITTNINGVGGVTYPGGAFPNGVHSVQVTIGRNNNTPTSAYHVQTGLATKTTVDVRVAQLVGGTFQFVGAGVIVPVVVVAKGW